MTVIKKWFYLLNNEVKGPHLEAEIKDLVQTNPSGLVWGQGLSDWVKPEEWQKTLSDLNDILSSLQADMNPNWRLKQNNFEAGPFIYDQLLQVLKAHPSPSDVMISQEGDPEGWKSIFSYPTIVEEVGITRRSHERVPISGLFVFEKAGLKHEALLSSISEGGLGIIDATGLSVGDVVKGVIQSPQLSVSINCSCEALYKHEDGSWGMRFMNMPMESQSLVIAYTQKFLK